MFGFAAGGSVSPDFLRLVTGLFDGFDDSGNIRLRIGTPAHVSTSGFQNHRRTADTGHTLNGIGNLPRTVRAGHAVDLQLRHDGILSRAGNFVEFRRKMKPAEGVVSAPFLPSGDQGHKGGFATLPKQYPIARRIIDRTPRENKPYPGNLCGKTGRKLG